MPKFTAPRGTADTLPDQSPRWRAVEAIARQVAEVYHFQEIRTPIFEQTQLFHRGIGQTSDIVSKETFTFDDRGGDSMTLRPEGTAGVVRAVIENNLVAQEGSRLKVYYIGPNFRYERPQKGRLRQHYQFGVEAFGVAEPEQDVECIILQLDFYRRCGVKDLSLHLNSLGDRDSKQRQRDALVAFLTPKAAQLSEDSQRRLRDNPLRILDSKEERDQAACQGAPSGLDALSDKSKNHFQRVQDLLAAAAVPFVIDPNLVRGLDYYTETLWEVVAGSLGAQNALGGGGRYDNLVEMLGGRPTPGLGFGSGLERLLLALEGQGVTLPISTPPLVWLIHHGPAARTAQWQLLGELRAAGIAADFDPGERSIKSQFKVADREKAAICLVVGDTELAAQSVVVKNMSNGQSSNMSRAEIGTRLKNGGAADLLANWGIDLH